MSLSPRMWRVLGIGAALLLLVAGWFALINPTLASAEALEVEAVSQHQASDQLRARISLLEKQSEELPAQEAILAEIRQQMPPTVALPTLIRNLTTVAEDANMVVASVTPGRPAPVEQPTAAPAAPADTGSGESSEAESGDSDSAEAEAASSDATSSGSAAPSGPQVEAVSLNIVACGTFAQVRNYLRELESMKRVVLVNGVGVARGSCAEGSAEDDLTATISAFVFTLPPANPVSDDVTSDAIEATKGDDDE